MHPIVLLIAAAAFGLTACFRRAEKDESHVDGGSDGTRDANGRTDGTRATDPGLADDGKTPAADPFDGGPASCDAIVVGDEYMSWDAGGGADGGRPETPSAPEAAHAMDAPCAFPASLSYDEADDLLLVACGGQPNALFRSQPLSQGGGQWAEAGSIQGYPSHHIKLSDRFYLVNHSMPDGLTIIDPDTGLASDEVSFADLDLKDGQGNALGFMPNNPAGAVEAGGLICIASSNTDHIDFDPTLTTFHRGTVICFPYDGGGTVDDAEAMFYFTSGKNPTGMTALGGGRFTVLSSNSYAPSEGEEAWLDIFETPAMTRSSVALGEATAQISPTIAISEGGLAVIGMQLPKSIIGVDLDARQIVFSRPADEVQNFISSVATWKTVAAASDFGIFGQGGSILYIDTDPLGWEGALVTPLAGAAGPSAVVGSDLYQAVTSNDGASGSIWRADLGALK